MTILISPIPEGIARKLSSSAKSRSSEILFSNFEACHVPVSSTFENTKGLTVVWELGTPILVTVVGWWPMCPPENLVPSKNNRAPRGVGSLRARLVFFQLTTNCFSIQPKCQKYSKRIEHTCPTLEGIQQVASFPLSEISTPYSCSSSPSTVIHAERLPSRSIAEIDANKGRKQAKAFSNNTTTHRLISN